MNKYPAWLKTLFNELEGGPGVRLKEIRGGSFPFAVGLVARKYPIAVVLNDPGKIFSFAEEIGAWRGRHRVFAMPPRADSFLPWPHSEDADHPERYRALAALDEPLSLSDKVFVLSPATLLQKIGSRIPVGIDVFEGVRIEREELILRLFECGYQPTTAAYQAGDFAVRGGIIDVFPPEGAPLRIELDDDEVRRLRYFDAASQRSTGPARRTMIKPMAEVPLDEESRNRAAAKIEATFESEDIRQVVERIRTGVLTKEDLSRYLPFFWEKPVSVLDRLPPETIVFLEDGGVLAELSKNIRDKIEHEYLQHPHKTKVCAPEVSYFFSDDLEEVLTGVSLIELGGPGIPGRESWPVIAIGAQDNEDIRNEIKSAIKSEFDADHSRAHHGALDPLFKRIYDWRACGYRVVLVSPDGISASRLEAMLREHGVEIGVTASPAGLLENEIEAGTFTLALAPLTTGFRMPASGWVVIAEEEVFGPKIRRLRPSEAVPSDRLDELKPDDYIVHIEHGIGIFRGLQKLIAGGVESDCARIEYADCAILYLPVHRMNLIELFSGQSDEAPVLDRLGGTGWANSISKARKAVEKIAKDLVDLYAARKVYNGHAFESPDSSYREFEAAFPYEETPDQMKAIEDVLDDMKSPKPMDRLVCGDVGYGKTEVALRAAFLAAMQGKQVAVLVPTTLLAHQHYRTFKQRLDPYPLRVEMVSRLRSRAEVKQTLRDLEAGKVDIIIGTHRLLQKDIIFSDLGLLIIDEEHRFGVKHKEKIKGMKTLVDVITMTATPIPRTLQLSLLAIWDISIIDTPPPDRLAIRTKVCPFDEDITRDAIRREMSRGGQVFFVAPRIQNLEGLKRLLHEVVPEAKVGTAHGRMDEKELEQVMIEFIEGRLDVLLSTSIIESGIDIPKANTILIYNAHNFGLATLYQLRGRVGRSKERAYAYLMIPGKLLLSRIARERLRAIEEFTQLGSGYRIARLDLKIRGAGNILGESQTGHIHRIGYEMYLDLLQREIRILKGEKVTEEIEPEIQIPSDAYLPDDYVADPQDRVMLYRRLSRTRTEAQLIDLKGELLDRFGPIPAQAVSLMGLIALKNILRDSLVKFLRREGKAIRFGFAHGARVSPEKLVALVNENPKRFRLGPGDEIVMIPAAADISSLAFEIGDILKRITERDNIEDSYENKLKHLTDETHGA